MKNTLKLLGSTVLALLTISSNAKAQSILLKDYTYDSHKPDSRYVAIGSSLSSGVRDGGINKSSQEASFPNLVAKQLGIRVLN